MLVLTTNTDEPIVIVLPDGRHIVVRLLEQRHSRHPRIGFSAPPDIKIWRQSVLDRMKPQGE